MTRLAHAAALWPLALVPAAAAQDTAAPVDAPEGTFEALELTLEEAIRLALGNNLDLQRAEVETEIARYDSLGSWGAFDWVFDASANVTDSEQASSRAIQGGAVVTTESTAWDFSFARPLTTGGSFDTSFRRRFSDTNDQFSFSNRQNQDSLTLAYTQPLLRGAWSAYATSFQREQEVLFRRQAEVQRQTRQTVAYNVQVAYWDLVSAIEQRAVADSAVELAESQLEQERRELEAGVGTEVDVVQARAELATRVEAQIQAANDVAQRTDDLRKLLFASEDEELWGLGLVPATGLPVEVSTEGLPDWKSAFALSLEMRSDLRQRRLDVDAAHIRLTRSISERLSGLDLELAVTSGSVDRSGTQTFEDTFSLEYPTYAATLRYNMAIGNRTARYAERAARGGVRTAQLQYDQAELDAVADVRAAVRSVYYAAEQVRATSESLVLARRQLEAEQARYDEGLSTTFQVLEFQQDLIEALSNERNARANFVKALAELERAQGVTGEGAR